MRVLFSSERKKKTRARKEKQRGGGTHSVLCHAWSATAARLPLIALSLFDRVSGGGPPALRFRAGLTSARRSPSGVAPFDRVSLVWLPTSTSTAGLSSDRGGDGEGEGEEAEGAPSSSSSGVARGRELRGRKCCLLAGARGRKRAEEEEERRGAAAAAAARGERRRSRSRPPTPPTADADDGDGAPRIVAPAATPSLLPRPEKPGADEAPAGSVQQAARIPAEQRRGEGARALLFSFLNGEREKDSGTARRERGQKKTVSPGDTNHESEERERRKTSPSFLFLSFLLRDVRGTRHGRLSCGVRVKLIASLWPSSCWERERERERETEDAIESFSLFFPLVWRLEPPSALLSPPPQVLTPFLSIPSPPDREELSTGPHLSPRLLRGQLSPSGAPARRLLPRSMHRSGAAKAASWHRRR